MRLLWISTALFLLGSLACKSFPPAITGVTVSPSDADGRPRAGGMWRTQLRPPGPVLGVRPGADPRESTLFLNQPVSGEVAITLARGPQNFLLYAAGPVNTEKAVIAVFLEHEPSPALTAVVDGNVFNPVRASRAATVMDCDGEPVPNHSSVSAIRKGYRISVVRAAFPLPDPGVDAVAPWRLQPDNLPDSLGLITVEVEPVAPG